MGLEIERKFLVLGQPWHGLTGTPIIQAYLSRDPKRIVRLRIAGEQAWLTLKGQADGPVRAEFEYPIPVEDAHQILRLLALPGQVEKTRYRIPHASHVWEVDVFAGRHAGLVTAEVEMTSPNEPIALPDWVGREITDDPAYSNSALSTTGSVNASSH